MQKSTINSTNFRIIYDETFKFLLVYCSVLLDVDCRGSTQSFAKSYHQQIPANRVRLHFFFQVTQQLK